MFVRRVVLVVGCLAFNIGSQPGRLGAQSTLVVAHLDERVAARALCIVLLGRVLLPAVVAGEAIASLALGYFD